MNFGLFFCVSESLFQSGSTSENINISVSDDDLPCFIDFLRIFDGQPFHWAKYSFTSTISLIQSFSISPLSHVISDSIPLPKSLTESLDFVSKDVTSMFEKAFSHSISIIVDNFQLLSADQVVSLPNNHIETILQSERLHYKNEDYLLQFILKLTERDQNRKALLKHVCFPAVSTRMMKSFLSQFTVEDLDTDLFEELKKRLCSGIFGFDFVNYSTRLEKHQLIKSEHSKKKIKD